MHFLGASAQLEVSLYVDVSLGTSWTVLLL